MTSIINNIVLRSTNRSIEELINRAHRVLRNEEGASIQSNHSDQFFLIEDFLESGVALPGGADEPGDGDDGGLSEVDGSVLVELGKGRGTSQTEIWMEEWSLGVMSLSV